MWLHLWKYLVWNIYRGIFNIIGIFWIISHDLGCLQLSWNCQKAVRVRYGLERNRPFSKVSSSDTDSFFFLFYDFPLTKYELMSHTKVRAKKKKKWTLNFTPNLKMLQNSIKFDILSVRLIVVMEIFYRVLPRDEYTCTESEAMACV